ncbi:hypothetical protein SAY87_023665 [Trapa incisa]|uniref:Transcription repressor n=1 Tax=Trapa incisa TaxID=236973 RepID=A0AAN7L116_9MYRT|nr:hypothetical protein SAY87_023665 [Trapa incisa]
MPNNVLWRNFHRCLFKPKCLPPPPSPLPASEQLHCRHQPPPEEYYASAIAPASDIIKNLLNSIHTDTATASSETSITSSNHSTSLTLHTTDDPFFTSSSDDSDFAAAAAAPASMPDLASVYASHRFFFSSPGRSNSIVDSSDSVKPASATTVAGTGGFTVQKYSSDPYGDFRRSMQEMIEVRDMKDLNDDSWEYLHKLLLCYLALNPKQTHKFIVGAFADTVLLLMSQPPPQAPRAALAGKPGKPGGRREWTSGDPFRAPLV